MKYCKNILAGILVIFFVVATSIYTISAWLDAELFSLEDKNVSLNSGDFKDKGVYMLQRSLRHGDLLLVGSSELSAPVEQNPINMYPNNILPANIDKVGRAHRQSLLDAIMLGALHVEPDSKIAIVISLQWFEGDDIDKKGFQSNFSELQFLTFLKNEQITAESKKYVCTRLADLLANESATAESWLWAKLHASDNTAAKFIKVLFEPYYEFKYRLLVLKDKYDAYKFLRDAEEKEYVIKDFDWTAEENKAYQQGMERCTNNKFFVYDEYYDKYLSDKIDTLSGRDANKELLGSKEIEDYRELLEISEQKDIKPYYVFMSTNGFYYDYIGQSQNSRMALYDYLKSEANKKGMPYLDLAEHEYEPYFYCDVMHLGWKGWLFVNENISTYFANR